MCEKMVISSLLFCFYVRICEKIKQNFLFYIPRNQVYLQGYRGFESHPLRQLRNSRRCSVSGSAGNCAVAGISSLSAATRFAGLAAEGDGG